MGSGVAGQVVGGLAGLFGGGTIDERASRLANTQQKMLWEPKTEGAQRNLQTVGRVMEPVADAANWQKRLGDPLYEATGSAALATLATIAPEVVLALGGLHFASPVVKQASKYNPDLVEEVKKFAVENPELMETAVAKMIHPTAKNPTLEGIGMQKQIGPVLRESNPKEAKAIEFAKRYSDMARKQGMPEREIAQRLYEGRQIYQDMSGTWRKWLDSEGSEFKSWVGNKEAVLRAMANKNNNLELSIDKFFDAPKLFKERPDAKKIKIVLKNEPNESYKGSFWVPVDMEGNFLETPRIDINIAKFMDSNRAGKLDLDSMRATVFHELSHWDDIKNKKGSGMGYKWLKENVTEIPKQADEHIKQINSAMSQLHEEITNLALAGKHNTPEFNKLADEWDRFNASLGEWSRKRDIYRDMAEGYNLNYPETHRYYDVYRHQIGGEVRAHDVGDRVQYMTPAEQNITMPDSALYMGHKRRYPNERIYEVLEQDRQFGEFGMKSSAELRGSDQIVHHASPHFFDQFDMSNMLGGEGGAGWGWGLYFSESPAVSGPGGHYGRMFQNQLTSRKGVLEDRIRAYEQRLRQPRGVSQVEAMQMRNSIADFKRELKDTDWNPTHYKVDIPDSKVEQMLLWDKPLTEQPKNVQEAVKKIWGKIYDEPMERMGSWDGGRFYEDLTNALGSDEAASLFLQKNGIPGTKYLDGDSRSMGYGSYNYVIYNQNIIKILHRQRGGKVEDYTKKFLNPDGDKGSEMVTNPNTGHRATTKDTRYLAYEYPRELGAHVAVDNEIAKVFYKSGKKKGENMVLSAYDVPKNPITVDDPVATWWPHVSVKQLLNTSNVLPGSAKVKLEGIRDEWFKALENLQQQRSLTPDEFMDEKDWMSAHYNKQIQNVLKDLGYDGVKYLNAASDEHGAAKNLTNYILFDKPNA
jgi:hypothetical protein